MYWKKDFYINRRITKTWKKRKEEKLIGNQELEVLEVFDERILVLLGYWPPPLRKPKSKNWIIKGTTLINVVLGKETYLIKG